MVIVAHKPILLSLAFRDVSAAPHAVLSAAGPSAQKLCVVTPIACSSTMVHTPSVTARRRLIAAIQYRPSRGGASPSINNRVRCTMLIGVGQLLASLKDTAFANFTFEWHASQR